MRVPYHVFYHEQKVASARICGAGFGQEPGVRAASYRICGGTRASRVCAARRVLCDVCV